MKVSDILRVKGGTLYTVAPESALNDAVKTMASRDIGAGPMMFRYWTGLYQNLASALVVGNGTGNWFPLRLNAPAEIIHLTLRKSSP